MCPVIDAIDVSTVEPRLDSALELRAIARDDDIGPAPLQYRWHATSGTFDDATRSNPKFTCHALGPVTITLEVSDGDTSTCRPSATRALTCVPPAPLSALGHLVVIFLENHSFDNLYGQYPGAEGLDAANAVVPQIDDASGTPYVVLPQTDSRISPSLANRPFDITAHISEHESTADPVHVFYYEQMQINDGKMDRFATLSNVQGLTVGYYPTAKLPLFQLMKRMPDQVTVCDHFFHAAFGGSFLNHIWLVAAASPVFPNAPDPIVVKVDDQGKIIPSGFVSPDGFVVNNLYSVHTPHPADQLPENLVPAQTIPTIGDRLDAAGVDWAWFAEGWNEAIAGQPSGGFGFHHQPFVYFASYGDGKPSKAQHLKDERDFLAGLAAGKLPPVSFVKPMGANNEHPGQPLIIGQNHAASLVESIVKSPLWKDTVVIVTYDENGGFWDHVPPPVVDRWGPGTRVPAIVFSPFAKGGVDATSYDTTAILKLIEKRWKVPPLGPRDAAQEDLSTHALRFAPDVEASPSEEATSAAASATVTPSPSPATPSPSTVSPFALPVNGPARRVYNRFAYIPPQCYAKTSDGAGRPTNSCYTCHQRSTAPNYVDDSDLQVRLQFPRLAAENPWQNLLEPPILRAERATDDDVLAYVRRSNYFDDRGEIAVAARLEPLPAAWDTEGDCKWNGYVPDARFHFDDRGFDVRPDGRDTGWRAFAYYPLPGAFAPANGSMADVLIRLDPWLRRDGAGNDDRRIYEINLAIVEALIARRDVPIDPADETALGVDLDLDGALGVARHVVYDAQPDGETRMRYVGRARDADPQRPFPIAPGLFPLGTEFLHSVRYLDVGGDGAVRMAARMKELRYAKKTNWVRPRELAALAALEPMERNESPSGARKVLWEFDRGVANGQGWLLSGFIEAADGSLRPQSYEETLYCAGCHGGIGATTDSMFALARKLGADAPARGWFHASARDLRGFADPVRRDGQGEYARYLLETGAGDDFRDNGELRSRFFDGRGGLRADAMTRLADDVATYLFPSAQRAVLLDRAYRAIVAEQSFTRGREVVLAPSRHAHKRAPATGKTGIASPVLDAPREPSALR